jgi:hypothetical protein
VTIVRGGDREIAAVAALLRNDGGRLPQSLCSFAMTGGEIAAVALLLRNDGGEIAALRWRDRQKSAWGKRVPYGRRWRGWLALPNVEWWGWRFWGGREGTRGKMALWGGIEFLWQFCSSFWGNGYNCAGYASKSSCVYGAKTLLSV